jgi:hypothetical protein
MSRIRTSALAIGAAALLWGCGGESGSDDTEVRDLSLAPAESIAALDDAPQSAPAPQQGGQQAADSISTRTHAAGDAVYATASADIVDGQGRVVIPAGARFEGVIAAILEAKNPGDPGTISLAFNRVAFGGKSYSVDATSDSVATERQGRGVTGGDAAKVGVGAAAGAVLGGLITKDTKGAIVGGVVGAAAGAGVAGATKDADVLLPAGGTIRIVLGSPMVLTPIS